MQRGEPPGARGRVAGAGVLLAVAVVAATLAGPWDPSLSQDRGWHWRPFLPPIEPHRPAPAVVPPGRKPPVHGTNHVLEVAGPWILGALGVLAVAALLLLLVRPVRRAVLAFVRRHRRGDEAPDAALAHRQAAEPDLTTLTRGAAEAGTRMHRDVAPTDAVVAAWVAMEEAARDCGVYREPSQTATELTVAVLDRTWVDPAATRGLLDLYLRARYGAQPLGPADADAAREALAGIERDLAEQHARWLAGIRTAPGDRP